MSLGMYLSGEIISCKVKAIDQVRNAKWCELR